MPRNSFALLEDSSMRIETSKAHTDAQKTWGEEVEELEVNNVADN